MAGTEEAGKVVVIGAGVVGLSTALFIQKALPLVKVTVITDKLLEQTVSIGAGGLFRPDTSTGPTVDIIKKWAKDGYEYYKALALSEDAAEAGVQLVSGYHLSSVSQSDADNEILTELLPDMRRTPVTELTRLFPEKFKFGNFYTTIITDPRYYLPWMLRKFLVRGNLVVHKVADIGADPVLDNYDVVVNCTGYGSKELVGDHRLVPIRGQTIKVKAPWIKHFYYADGAYVIPMADGIVTLGGIKEYGDHNMRVTKESRDSIWTRCVHFVPSLEKAEVCWEWVGLRPFRQPIRVEKEVIGGRNVVHNYGHGGNGVSLSYGTAVTATRLVTSFLENRIIASKL